MTEPLPDLARHLRRRLLPLCAATLSAIALGVPLAYLALGMRATRALGEATAAQAARDMQQADWFGSPLWTYNTQKFLDHLRAFRERPGIVCIEVERAGQGLLDSGSECRGQAPSLLWASAELRRGEGVAGRLWVAMDAGPVWRGAMFVSLPAFLLGLFLAGALFWIPLRTIRGAQARLAELFVELQASRDGLARLNARLEGEVAERTATLADTVTALEQERSRMRELSQRWLSLQEVERRAVARELHDGVGQALTALRLDLEVLGAAGGEDAKARQTVARARARADDAIEEVRRAAARLGPAMLDELGLVEAVRRYLADFRERTGTRAELALPPLSTRFPPEVESACFRFIQEGLTNVSRHAGASTVRMEMAVRTGELDVRLEDDGRGFSPGESEGRGLGLRGIRERVALLGGSFSIESAPGQGTRLRVRLPLPAASADAGERKT
ncbi:MAG: sensor histidine kinase [Myxococcales bacterium]|nr:sensor histidine kinase [Myxococcales bacterium]